MSAGRKKMSFLKNAVRLKKEFFRAFKLRLMVSKYYARDKEIDYKNINKVLLLRLDDKIGDMIVASGVIRFFAERNVKVYLLTGPLCADLLAHSEYVEKVFIYKRRESLKPLQQECFDVVIDFDDVVTYERCRLVHKLSAKHSVGFNKGDLPIYRKSIEFLDPSRHITERHRSVLRLFASEEHDYRYHLPIHPDAVARVDALVSSLTYKRLIAINPLTGSKDKDLSADQVQQLVYHIKRHHPQDLVVLIGMESKISAMGIEKIVYVEGSTVRTAVEIVRRADVIVSPDTSIVHMCNAFNKPLLAIYNKRKLKDTGLVGYEIWAPNYARARQLVVESEQVSQLSNENLQEEFDRLLSSV
ncbi:glycosyltransferase family 9 protein [Salinicola socius]|nr:glycosyltransferase family 9 protein [Salinicola socius]